MMKLFIKALKQKFPVDKFFFRRSYSQEGEDMIYRSFYESRKHYKGFYVDIGAHHPYRFSNTLHFYQKGWRGINIEPTPTSKKLFDIFRKRDINLNIGISRGSKTLPFYCFNEPALNSFSKEVAEQKSASKYHLINTISVETLPLGTVLDNYLPPGQVIDFMNIDTEGFDLEVLESNNWERYIPLFIMVEANLNLANLASSPVYNYLTQKNYELIAKTMRTLLFKLK
jgi:FkbM family methyltransferase